MPKKAPAVTSRDVLSGRFCLKKDTVEPVRKSVKRSFGRVVGYFPSKKSGRSIGWESQLEEKACHRFEYSRYIHSYLEQPVRIKLPSQKNQTYTPDFKLMFRGGRVGFVEIKPLDKLKDSVVIARLLAAQRFFNSFGCSFFVISDKELPKNVVQRNIRLLMQYIGIQVSADTRARCLAYLNHNKVTALHELCALCDDPSQVCAMLANHTVTTDISSPIGPNSIIYKTQEKQDEYPLIHYRTAPDFKQHKVLDFRH